MNDDRFSVAEDEPRSESGPLRKTGLVVLAVCGELLQGALGQVLAGVLLVVVIGGALFAFFARLLLVEPVSSVVGLPEQGISALVGAGVIIGFWVVVFRWLVDW